MRQIKNLVHITGGSKKGSEIKISDVGGLFKAIEENPTLSETASTLMNDDALMAALSNPELMNALSNPALMRLFSDPTKLDEVLALYQRLDKKFLAELPETLNRAKRLGLL